MAHSPLTIFSDHVNYFSDFNRINSSRFCSIGKEQHGKVCRLSTYKVVRLLGSEVKVANSRVSAPSSPSQLATLIRRRSVKATIETKSNGIVEENANYVLADNISIENFRCSKVGVDQMNKPQNFPKRSSDIFPSIQGDLLNRGHISPKEICLACALLGLGFSYFIIADWAEAAILNSKMAVRSAYADLALGNGGPLVEEFWDNMRRYGLYFLTVATGGLYSIVQPLTDLVKNPVTAALLVIILSGSFYLLYLTLSTMLGILDFDYEYSP